MRKSILIISLLLAITLTQEIVLDSYTSSYDSGTPFSKSWKNANWNSYTEFSVYGWLKINSQLTRSDWSTCFFFTQNDGDVSQFKQGDRVLTLFTYQGNLLHSPTYNTGNTNQFDNLSYDNTDTDKWNFFYVSVGQNSHFAYYKLAQSGEKTKKMTNIVHIPSTFYRLFVGQAVNTKYWPGSISGITLQAGPGAYREANFQQLFGLNPTALPTCPTFWTGCAYTGDSVSVCDENQVISNQFQSVWIPTTCSQGYKISFNNYYSVFKHPVQCMSNNISNNSTSTTFIQSSHEMTIKKNLKGKTKC